MRNPDFYQTISAYVETSSLVANEQRLQSYIGETRMSEARLISFAARRLEILRKRRGLQVERGKSLGNSSRSCACFGFATNVTYFRTPLNVLTG